MSCAYAIIISSMRIRIRAFATIREAIGTGQTDLEIPDDTDVGGLIKLLTQKFGEQFSRLVLAGEGKLAPYVKFLVNGREIDYLDGMRTKLKNMDEVAIIPPVAGG